MTNKLRSEDPSNQAFGTYSFGDLMLRPPRGSRLDQLCLELREEFPALVMQRKREHWYWRWIAVFLKILTFGKQDRFLTHYTTVVGMKCAWGDNRWDQIQAAAPGWDDDIWSTLMHERKHLRRFKRYGVILCALLYLLVFFPVGLAWGRAWFEREGYLETLRCWYVLNPAWACSNEAREWWVGQFTGASYGWAWPFKKQVRRWYDTELARLKGATTSSA